MPQPPPKKTAAAKKANYTGGRPKDESKLSQKPSQIRVRLRRASKGDQKRDGRMVRDMEMLYKKPIEDWDAEELARGRPRNSAGTFAGRTPSWISPTIIAEAKRRLLENTFGSMAAHAEDAIKTVHKLMTSDEIDDKGKPIVDARTQLAAATFVIEHIVGKPTAVFEVTGEDFTKQAIAAAIVLDDGADQSHLVLDGVAWTDEEEEPTDVE